MSMQQKPGSRRTYCQLRLLELPEPAGAPGGPAAADAGNPLPAGDAGVIWRAAGMPVPVLASDEAARISPDSFARLTRLGILVSGGRAGAVSCLACELDHAEGVEPGPAGTADERRFFISCPENGRVEVPAGRVQRWGVEFTPLARAIREGLGDSGAPEEIRPGRLWRLGRASLGGRLRELWLIREAVRPRGAEGTLLAAGGEDSVIFVLGGRLPEELASSRGDRIFRAEELVGLTDRGFRLDRTALTARFVKRRGARAGGGRRAVAETG